MSNSQSASIKETIPSFEDWVEDLDVLFFNTTQMSIFELPDQPLEDWYNLEFHHGQRGYAIQQLTKKFAADLL